MQISRRTQKTNQKVTNFIDFEGSYDQNELIYCQKCYRVYRVNVLSVLGPRLLCYDKTPAADYDLWLKFPRYGKLVSVDSVKHENELTEVIEIDNPNDNNPHFASIGSKKR
jgi:hypothetical protein